MIDFCIKIKSLDLYVLLGEKYDDVYERIRANLFASVLTFCDSACFGRSVCEMSLVAIQRNKKFVADIRGHVPRRALKFLCLELLLSTSANFFPAPH